MAGPAVKVAGEAAGHRRAPSGFTFVNISDELQSQNVTLDDVVHSTVPSVATGECHWSYRLNPMALTDAVILHCF